MTRGQINKTAEYFIPLAQHYKAIGDTEIHLYSYYEDDLASESWENDLPWGYLTDIDADDSSYDTYVKFEAKHPSGLTFTWSMSFTSSRRGKDATEDRTRLYPPKMREVAMKVPKNMRPQLVNAFTKKLKKYDEDIQQSLTWLKEAEARRDAVISMINSLGE